MKIGFIDWTEKKLALYVFEKNGGQYKLTDSTSVPLEGEPDPSTLNSLVKSDIQDIYLSLPLDLLTLREQTFPFQDSDKIRDTIAFELEGILLGSTSDYSIDHVITGSTNSSSNVLAVCLEKNKLKEVIDIFSSAGLDPKVITALDICIGRGNTEELFEKTISDTGARIEAAGKEIMETSINLRQKEMAFTGDIEKLKKNLRSTLLLLLVLVIIFGLNSAISLMKEKKEHRILKTGTESFYISIFPEDRNIVDLERQLTGNIKRLEVKKDALLGVPVLDILRTIADRKVSGIVLNEFNADANTINIKGTAGTFKDVDSFKNVLSDIFQRVKVMDSGATADKKINFTIIMQIKST
jgi:type II secretory pathway component PulL